MSVNVFTGECFDEELERLVALALEGGYDVIAGVGGSKNPGYCKGSSIHDEVYTLCEAVGLPTTLADIGLSDVSDADLMAVAEATCAEGETIHNELVPVTPANVIAALKDADAEVRRRQNA